MFRLLWQSIFGKRMWSGDCSKSGPSNRRLTWPIGKTDLIGDEAAGKRKQRSQRHPIGKEHGAKDPPKMEKPPEKTAGNGAISPENCPFCDRVVRRDASECPGCGLRFCKEPAIRKTT